jgi:hypothetical protein
VCILQFLNYCPENLLKWCFGDFHEDWSAESITYLNDIHSKFSHCLERKRVKTHHTHINHKKSPKQNKQVKSQKPKNENKITKTPKNQHFNISSRITTSELVFLPLGGESSLTPAVL